MGRRFRPKPAPDREGLTSRTVHEVVRDYPEALVALRRVGVDVPARGGSRLGGLPDGERAVRTVLDVTAWRPDPPPTPSTGKMGGAPGDSMGAEDESAAPDPDAP